MNSRKYKMSENDEKEDIGAILVHNLKVAHIKWAYSDTLCYKWIQFWFEMELIDGHEAELKLISHFMKECYET